MFKECCFILLVLAVTACAPSPAQLTSTTSVSQVQTETSTPSATPTSSPTLTQTPTPIPTETPIPTPLGGSGELLFLNDLTLYSMKPDGSDLKTLVSQSSFMEAFSIKKIRPHRSVISPDGKKVAVWMCDSDYCAKGWHGKLHLFSTDLSSKASIPLGMGVSDGMAWSPDSESLLFQIYVTKPFLIDSLGLDTFIVSTASENFGKIIKLGRATNAVWSYDSKQVYLFMFEDFSIINSDGSNKHSVQCDLCPPTIKRHAAVSNDGHLAFIASNKIIIVAQDLSSSKSFSSSSNYYYLMWFPDNKRLLITNLDGKPNSILDIESGEEESLTFTAPKGAILPWPCLVSPDGKNIFFSSPFGGREVRLGPGSVWIPKYQFILLKSSDNSRLTRLTTFLTGIESCPVWISNSE